MPESRLVRDLLETITTLSAQIVELSKVAIGAPAQLIAPGAPMSGMETKPFALSGDDDWQDIPDDPQVPSEFVGAHIYEIPRRPNPREVTPDLPLHMAEDEEDMRFRVGAGYEEPKALADLLDKLGAPSNQLVLEPLA